MIRASDKPAIGERAVRTSEFLDSIGIVTHWTYPDTPYGFAYLAVRQKLIESGIRHVRDGFNNRIIELGRLGVKSTIIVEPRDGAPRHIVKRIKEINAVYPSIFAVEGPNEPDLFWGRHNTEYRGKGFPEGVVNFQRELFEAIKGDPATADITVIALSLGMIYGKNADRPNPFADETLADCVDYGNFHPYPHGISLHQSFPYVGLDSYYKHANFPSINLDEIPSAFEAYAAPFLPKPMVATETGYSTYRRGSSETTHAKYVPRLFFEYFRLGVRRTWLYELVDEFRDFWRKNREAHFGLLRRSLRPKPAYTAVKSLISLLHDEDPGDGSTPGTLAFSVNISPPPGYERTDYVHHLLLQKSSGVYYLAMWHEITGEDTSITPHRQITHPDLPAVIEFFRPLSSAVCHAFDASWNLRGKALDLTGNTIRINIPDQVVILELDFEKMGS
jgi:hypothetical protein